MLLLSCCCWLAGTVRVTLVALRGPGAGPSNTTAGTVGGGRQTVGGGCSAVGVPVTHTGHLEDDDCSGCRHQSQSTEWRLAGGG